MDEGFERVQGADGLIWDRPGRASDGAESSRKGVGNDQVSRPDRELRHVAHFGDQGLGDVNVTGNSRTIMCSQARIPGVHVQSVEGDIGNTRPGGQTVDLEGDLFCEEDFILSFGGAGFSGVVVLRQETDGCG